MVWWSVRLNDQERQLLGFWEQLRSPSGRTIYEFRSDRTFRYAFESDLTDIARSGWNIRNGKLHIDYGSPGTLQALLMTLSGHSFDEDTYDIVHITEESFVISDGKTEYLFERSRHTELPTTLASHD